jgi:hypothetical protein
MPGMELPKVAGRNKQMAAQLKLANGMEFGLKRTAFLGAISHWNSHSAINGFSQNIFTMIFMIFPRYRLTNVSNFSIQLGLPFSALQVPKSNKK